MRSLTEASLNMSKQSWLPALATVVPAMTFELAGATQRSRPSAQRCLRALVLGALLVAVRIAGERRDGPGGALLRIAPAGLYATWIVSPVLLRLGIPALPVFGLVALFAVLAVPVTRGERHSFGSRFTIGVLWGSVVRTKRHTSHAFRARNAPFVGMGPCLCYGDCRCVRC